ncbi:hypothetical protein AGMMS4956_07320 [Bacteroidia bacterium]|nr:hypothetical protein AGMMS4956_07320 [Bacteroidia bacterium]
MKENKTFNALIARGFDSNLANILIGKGYTVIKLQNEKEDTLKELGIDEKLITVLFEKRPPIPEETVNKLLYESKRTCCICRDNSKSIIIHHIEEWYISHNHNEENLVILCLQHHDEAHTKRKLSLNLSKDNILASKKRWTEEVKSLDRKVILNLVLIPNYSHWDYFNHNRIFELYIQNNISNSNFKTTSQVKNLHLINELGTFSLDKVPNYMHLYHFGNGYLKYNYMSELFYAILQKLPFIDITDKFTKNNIKSLIQVGTYIAIQAGFYFKQEKKDLFRKGYYEKRGIKIEFIIDPYECTSVSSYCCHISGHKTATVIALIKSIIEDKKQLLITVSCLSIGCNMRKHIYNENRDINLMIGNNLYEEDYDE